MDIRQYLDSTYLETAQSRGISQEENLTIASSYIKEAIENDFKLIMIRPDVVSTARKMIDEAGSQVLVGTVIAFPEGTASIDEKLAEAKEVIENGADELDFVVNYPMYKRGKVETISEEVRRCTELTLNAGKTAKWIIETAALREDEIEGICELIKDTVIDNFGEENAHRVFLKTSTGFYKTEGDKPAGATIEALEVMKEWGSPLPLKAAGGVRDMATAITMIEMGVTRIGTSSALKLYKEGSTSSAY